MSERVIRQLLAEAGRAPTTGGLAQAKAQRRAGPGGLARSARPRPTSAIGAPTTSPRPAGSLRDKLKTYARGAARAQRLVARGAVARPAPERACRWRPGRRSRFRFHARDLHLVLGSATGKPVRFRVTLDGQPPGADAGVDVAADGTGVVKEQRLYQLVRQKGAIRERTFTIEFLDPGAEAFAFTFG